MYPLRKLPFKNLFPMLKSLTKKVPKLPEDKKPVKLKGLEKLQSMKGKFDMHKDILESLQKENRTLNNYI